ncbi:MAG: RHS repeat-associated core domain-containing protein [Bacteroidales bacterium]|jgi:RHS repeat-associated protein
MHLTYNAINSQYAVKQSLPLGGDLEGFYAFNAKELDEENGMYYYSARYYAPPTFISRDPLFEKYPSISPYTYCGNNPIKYIDPDGRWVPGLSEDGQVTYTAEKGDNMSTFRQQYGLNAKTAGQILGKSGITNDNQIKAGKTTISGETVKGVTGNEVLKGSWGNMTNNQKANQIVFAIAHSVSKGEGSFDMKDYMTGFQVGGGGVNLSNVSLPTSEGNIPIQNISFGATYEYTKVQNSPIYKQDDRVNKSIYDFRTAAGKGYRPMIMFTLDSKYSSKFEKVIKYK